MKVEQLHPIHMLRLQEQGVAQAGDIIAKPGYLKALIDNGPAFAGVANEGVVAAVGMSEQNPGNFRCWAVSDPVLTRKYFLSVVKAMLAFFAKSKARRIETIVQDGNAKGHRWVMMLGFGRPHLMTRFNEYGHAWLYEMVDRG